jgi:class III lanthionine synthetase
MLSRDNLVNLLAHAEFYETINYYKPREEDLVNPVKELLGPEWKLLRGSVWFVCFPPDQEPKDLPIQGWKIHVSSNIINAREILNAVIPVLKQYETSFKFALDTNILSLMNGKAWARQGAGKFITIYPAADKFKSLIEDLYSATKNLEGLYILSDKRYKDSKTVFYRYGGMRQHDIFNIKGERTPVLVSPDGQNIPDRRLPYYAFPEWTEEPFPTDDQSQDQKKEAGGVLLNNGRYFVDRVLFFSNSGGVYLATDRETDQRVVIKEARPHVTLTEDAVALLKKEHRILTKLQETGIAPQPIDFFQDWEHHFLVEEYIEGIPLTTYSARHNVTLLTRPTLKDTVEFYESFKKIFSQVARIIDLLHQRNLVFGDLSPNNIIIRNEDLKVRIIDFEAAFEVGVNRPIYLYTPGFASSDQVAGTPPTFENDYYSLGAIMHYFLAPINTMFKLKPDAKHEFLDSVIPDIGFPASVKEIIQSLFDDDVSKRPKPIEVAQLLEKNETVEVPALQCNDDQSMVDYWPVIEGISNYTLHVATYNRTDRLFPADSRTFSTNPLSIAYGACGIVYALKRMNGRVPDEAIDWMLSQEISKELYPPGFYLGMAGIGWVLLELGLRKEAVEVMKSSFDHPLLDACADLYFGLSGWGIANLKFFLETEDEIYLQKAKEAGEQIISTATEDETGWSWPYENSTYFGLGHGGSGVSLFLLYLYLTTGEEKFLNAGQKALDFDLNHSEVNLDGGASWKYRVSESSIILPYWRYGSAGVGTAVLRYYKLLGEEKYKTALDKIYLDTDRKYAVFPGRFIGLSGIGDFLLDMFDFLDEEQYLKSAERLAAGLMLFKVEKEQGIVFPGDRLLRLSCDYGTGSAGVGLFLHRLMTRGGSAFVLDELLENKSVRSTELYEPDFQPVQ